MRRLVRVGFVLAVLLALLILVAPGLLRPTGSRLAPTEDPAEYGLPYESVTFKPPDRDISLGGWWIPAANARAALVFVHGGGADNRSLPYGGGLALARDLAASGYALLMVDLRNFGSSDGTPEGITYGELETNDVVGAVDYISARDAKLPVGAIGFSMGGATVLRASARERRLRAVVADSAFADVRDVAVAFTHAATGLPGFFAAPFVWSAEHVHGAPLARGATVDALRGASFPPVLLIHNEHDPIVPVEHCRRLASIIPNAKMWITQEAEAGPFGTHIKSYLLAPQRYVEELTRFLGSVF